MRRLIAGRSVISGGLGVGASLGSLWQRLTGYAQFWQFTVLFAVVSLILVSVTGFGLSRYLAHDVRSGEIDSAAKDAQGRVASLITSQLSPEQLSGPLSEAEYAALDEFVQDEVISGDTIRVHIWGQDGMLLYSSEEASGIGQVSPPGGDLADALGGDVGAGVLTVDSQQQLAVYGPLSFDDVGRISAALEIYEAYAPLAARIQRFETTIYVGVAAALGFLYAALIITVERGTQAHSRQRRLLMSRSQELKRSQEALLHVLSIALDLRDRVSKGHSLRAAHDLGRTVLTDKIRERAGPLSAAEWEEVQKHPEVAHQIVRDVPFLRDAGEIIYCHHERWDGGGYPRGIRGPEIPLGGRIFAVADAYDAITSDRPHRKAASHASALAEIERYSGTQFDPKVVEALLGADTKGLMQDGATSDGESEEPTAVSLVAQTAAEEKGDV
jgi:hypothetical protein